MTKNLPTRMTVLKFVKSDRYNDFFGAFQVKLSNGVESPVFRCLAEGFKMESVNVPDFSKVKRINGSK
jgi:hypothetical protein